MLLTNPVSYASTHEISANLKGVNYKQAICIFWMGSSDNQLKPVHNLILNASNFPCGNIDKTFGLEIYTWERIKDKYS